MGRASHLYESTIFVMRVGWKTFNSANHAIRFLTVQCFDHAGRWGHITVQCFDHMGRWGHITVQCFDHVGRWGHITEQCFDHVGRWGHITV